MDCQQYFPVKKDHYLNLFSYYEQVILGYQPDRDRVESKLTVELTMLHPAWR